MPPRSKEEKERRKLRRKKLKEAEKVEEEGTTPQKEAEKKAKDDDDEGDGKPCTASVSSNPDLPREESASPLLRTPDDALLVVLAFLNASDLGVMTLTCRSMNYIMERCRVPHMLSRLQRHSMGDSYHPLTGKWQVRLCENESEVREILQRSLQDVEGPRKRLTTKKGKQSNGDADEYVSFARFLEEAACHYAAQTLGRGPSTQLLPPVVNGRFASVSPEHTLCRIGGDGLRSGAGGSGVASWGVGKRGQLGHGKRIDEKHPRLLLGGIGWGIRIVQVSAGGGLVRVAHSLLLTSTGRVLSFGNAQYGQLGHGYTGGKTLSDALRPQYIEALSHVRCICVSAGELHSAAVTTDGDLYTWGDGFCGQLGHADKRPQLLPVQVTAGALEDECVASVSCGCRHTLCVTEEGEVFSFGLGHFGVLGREYTPFEYDADRAIEGLEEADRIEPSRALVAASQTDPFQDSNAPDASEASDRTEQSRGHLDLLFNLTLDDSSTQCIPTVVESLKGVNVVGVSAGHRHSMVLDDRGGVYTFGIGTAGALGHGDFVRQEFPLKVMEFDQSGVQIMQISAGVDISMAVSTAGDVYAWGKASSGRIGLGKLSADVTIPREVKLCSSGGKKLRAVDVECGYVHSVVVAVDGTIHMCGGVGVDGDADGQTEDELMDASTAGHPVQVADFSIWHRIAEPKAVVSTERWQKYGKYELKGRSAMMAESSRWS